MVLNKTGLLFLFGKGVIYQLFPLEVELSEQVLQIFVDGERVALVLQRHPYLRAPVLFVKMRHEQAEALAHELLFND